MAISLINGATYAPMMNNQISLQAQNASSPLNNTNSEAYISGSSALASNEVAPVVTDSRKKEKAVWVAPVIKEGAAEIKKEQGLNNDAPVFIERRHRIQAVKYDRRRESRKRTLIAEDAVDMNDHEKAERTNKVGEYCLQRFGKTAPRNGGRFDLNA